MLKLVKINLFLFCASLFSSIETPDHIVHIDRITGIFINDVQKKYAIKCTMYGGQMPYNIENVALGFSVNQSATIEEARHLEVTLIEYFIKLINQDAKIRPYLAEYPFPASRAGISLSFNDNSVQPEHVSYVSQINNALFYYNEKERNNPIRKPLLKEPYPESLKIIQNTYVLTEGSSP